MQELNSIREGKYGDDVKGGWLDPILVRKAREEDMQHVKKHAVYEKVPVSQCWKETGKNTIKTGWADTDKGTSESPNKRSSSRKQEDLAKEKVEERPKAREKASHATRAEGLDTPRRCAPVKDGLTTWSRTRPKGKTPINRAAGLKRTTPTGVLWQRFLFDELSTRTA